MATYTSKLNLKKPEGNELFNRVQDLNDNWDKIDAIDSSDITFTPTGNLSSTNVQNALAELDTEKASKLFATNLVTNGDFSNGTTGWTLSLPSDFSIVDGKLRLVSSSIRTFQTDPSTSIVIGRKYYVKVNVSDYVSGDLSLSSVSFAGATISMGSSNGNHSLVVTAVNTNILRFAVLNPSDLKMDNIILIDLTTLFGSGNEPTKEQMDWIFTERDRLALGHLNGTAELLPMVSLLNLINKKANIAQEAWITPTLANGWVHDATRPLKYYKDNFGVVRLKGQVSGGTVGVSIFQLPSGYRCSTGTNVYPVLSNNILGVLYLFGTGNVSLASGSNISVAFNNVSFKAEQ